MATNTPTTIPDTTVPLPLSFQQLLGNMLSSYASSLGINDQFKMSANVQFFKIVALVAARSSGDFFGILRDYSLDRATGSALDRLGQEYGVPRNTAKVTTGFVTVIDTSFQKIDTKIYAGFNPPNIGSTTIYVADASLFPATGSLYLGRSTADVEGPITYGTTTFSYTGSTTNLSYTVSGLTSTAGLLAGFPVSGTNIQPGTVIASVDSSSQITLSLVATGTGGGIVFTFSTPPVRIGSYWAITLASGTTKYHNLSESVILAQGGIRVIPINTVVIQPGIGGGANIQFTITQQALILDGETTVSNVPVTASLPGASGNSPAGSITQFSGAPFPNATVTNPVSFTTGADLETDDLYRVRIKAALASTGLGTVTAIESALNGVQDPNSSATIVSTDILNSSSNTIVYVDDGTGYEATWSGVGIESIVNSALGGEQYFQLVTGGKQTSVTKALLETVAATPFGLNGGEVLEVVVGNITYQHTFASTDFQNPGSATAYEVTASINADTTLAYEAVTSGDGVYVVIRPIAETIDVIQVKPPSSTLVVDANLALQFPSNVARTLRLYKNGILLTEDGSTASIFTQPQSLWSNTLSNGETLSLSVDGTQPITYTLTNSDFVAEGTYQTLSASNSLQSWVNVLNNVLTGVTATAVGATIELTSNLGAVNRAKITVVNTIANPTSLISKGVISNTDLTSTGVLSDYILDRNTAQIQLAVPLVKGDQLSAGTLITEATIKAGSVPSGSVTLTANAHVWILIDSPGIIIPTIQAGSELSVSVSGDIVTYTSSSLTSFSNVFPGDYVIIWSSEIPTTDQLEGRVHAVTGSTLTIKVTAAEAALVTPVSNVPFVQGFVVIRTANVPQKFEMPAGTSTLDVIAAELQTQTDSLMFTVFDNTNIVVTTNTLNTEGEVIIVTADAAGQAIGFKGGSTSTSQDALIAFYESSATTAELPLFFHSTISTDSYANPIDSWLTGFSSSSSLSAFDPNEIVSFLNPYGIYPTTSGTLTLVSGTGDATITFSAFTIPVQPNQYSFTVSSANATVGAVYSNNGLFFTVSTTIVAGTTLATLGAGLVDDEQTSLESVQMSALSGSAVTILPRYPDVRRLRIADRFYVANPLDFGYNDTVVTIVDNNPSSETYVMPLYRRAIVNSVYPPNNYSFDAYDVDAGPTASFTTNFTGFDFSNFKALMQAKYVLQGSNAQTALLYRSTPWGRSGTAMNVSYVYPTSANQPINSIVTITPNNEISVLISLISGAPISSGIGANTQWNVTVTPNTPTAGIDQVTYKWAGQYTFTTTGVANQYTFTVSSANATAGAVYSNNSFSYTVSSTISAGTTLTTIGTGTPLTSGTLTLVSGTGDATITFSSFTYGGSNATAGAVYTNNGQSFTVVSTISDQSTLVTAGSAGNVPLSSGTLTKTSGTGDATIPYSSYTFTGAGANPSLTLSGGEYVTILPSTGFSPQDIGTFRVSTAAGFTPTSTSFSVQVPTGTAVPQLNAVTNILNGISFYTATPTTAAAINTYVNANLEQYLTTTIVNDGGTSGSGIIALSTYEDSGFMHPFYFLKDGINWIASSNITGNPQFTFKEALTYPSDTGYSFFTSGDEVRLIPTTMDQVQRLWSILAVTGFTTVGTVEVADRGTKLQLATETLGSVGAIQIVGGSGNEYTVPILTSGELLGNNEMLISANSIAAQAVASDQWFRLQAQNFQTKDTGIGNNTSVTVLSNTPIAGESTVTLLNRESGQLYFGAPRNSIRVEGDTFRIEKQGLLTCLSWNGIGTDPGFESAVNINDSGGWTVDVSAGGTYTNVSGNTNFSALSIGDLITITGMVNAANNGTFFVTGIAPNGLSFSVSNSNAVVETGTAITAGEFTATTGVSEGDTVILSSPFSPLNQGEYRVIRENNNSIWYENSNSVEEEVTCIANTISTGYDSTTEFNVTVSGGIETLSWDGTGTSPMLGIALPGDVVTFGSGFTQKYIFTVTSANATAGATYTNNGYTYTVLTTIVAGTTLTCSGPSNPTVSGTLTKTSGTGDATITFSAFATSPINQGSFVVTSSGPTQQQIVQLNLSAGATFTSTGPGDYFELFSGGNVNKYYIWYNVTGGSNTDPAPIGFTGIEVTINASDSSATVAAETYAAINGHLTAMTSSYVALTSSVTVTATVPATTNIPVDVSMPAAFAFIVTQLGQRAFLTVINPSGAPQTGISSVTFSINRPQMLFYQYEATVPGDKLSVNGTVLGSGNAGVYNILQILSPTTVVISGVITQQFETNVAGNFASLSVQEGTAYTGYKQVAYVSAQPGATNFTNIVFNTSAQYEKIDLSAGVAMTSLGKLNFPTVVRLGIDSYNYDTGLIGEANRVVYGDPRDAITYPGVNAAGTNIFIREPLLFRVKVSLAIRTNIGVSFSQITQQIQSSVYSLILSNPLGTNLDLSEIISTVRPIPGVTSCVIVSPPYNINSDEIVLATGQKAFVIQLSDISVSLLT